MSTAFIAAGAFACGALIGAPALILLGGWLLDRYLDAYDALDIHERC